MHSVITNAFHVFALSPFLLYGVAFIGIILEANTVLLTISFLTAHGVFDLPIIIPVVFVAAIAGNFFWYGIGYASILRPNAFARLMHTIFSPFDHHLFNRPFQTIFLTHFVYGLNCASLVRSGQRKMDLKVFFRASTIAVIVWMFIVGAIGYFSGSLLKSNLAFIKHAEIGLLAIIIIFLFAKHWFGKFAKKKLKD